MTHSHQLTDIAQIKRFVRAGKARFTLVSKKTGARVTYKVRASKDGNVHFVSTLTGPDNTTSYTFLGTIFSSGEYRHGSRSSIAPTAASAVAFEYFFRAVAQGDVSKIEFWHEGRCGRCGRVLTVPGSIETGFGPECAGLMGLTIKTGGEDQANDSSLRPLIEPFDGEEDPEDVGYAMDQAEEDRLIHERDLEDTRRAAEFKMRRDIRIMDLIGQGN